MAKDIEEFLKMAAQRRQQQKQNAGGQPSPAARPQPPVPPSGQNPPAQKRPPVINKPAPNPPQKKRVQPNQPVRQLTQQSVSDHVRHHLDTRDVTAHAERLGESVGLADEKLEGHLQDVFDHTVSTMGKEKSSAVGTSASSNRNTSKIAAQLHAMLRSPTSVRQAIVLAEILKRPDFD